MKHKRKLTPAAVASTMLLCSVFPADPAILPLFRSALTAYAAGSVTLDADGKTLLLNGAFTREQLDAFSENENVQKIEAKEGCILPEDCSYLFAGDDTHWRYVKYITLKSADSSNVTDMSHMFENIKYLEHVDMTSLNTSNVTDMSYMFNKCNYLYNINMDSINTSKVTNMSHMFFGCLDIYSNFDTSNVTDMSYMFADTGGYDYNLLNITNLNTSKTKNMSHMFERCSAFSIDISHFDTSNVEDMTALFKNCYDLRAVAIGNLDISCTTDMSQMFMKCGKLTELNLSGLNTSNIQNTSEMFADCKILNKIYVSDRWNIKQVTKSDDMFRNCNALIGEKETKYAAANTDIAYCTH